jgi:hypothetical protein
MPKTEENKVLAANIRGNLGLVLMQMGSAEGKDMLEGALGEIKGLKGETSYDYTVMYQHYLSIVQK